jgi:multidrug resistance efflux pump
MKRLVAGGLSVIAVAVTALVVWRVVRQPADEVRLTGTVSANEVLVTAEVAGRILELKANEGDRVSRGQVVAVLATEKIEGQIQSKRAAVERITARLEEERERIRLETERVESQIDAATATLRAMEKERVMVRAELDKARADLARARDISKQGLIARQELDRQATLVDATEAKWKSAENKVKTARAEVERERAGERKVRVMQQELQQTAAQAAQARYELERITVRLGPSELTSPVAGVVTAEQAREGELVSAGAPVMAIADPTDVWVEAEADDELARRLVVGQPVRVVLASGEEVDGKVSFISPKAESTFGVKVALLNPEGGARPGTTASIIVPGPGGIAPPDSTVPLPEATPRKASLDEEPGPGTEALPPAVTGPNVAEPTEDRASSKPAEGNPTTEEENHPEDTTSKPIESEPRQTRTDSPEPSAPNDGAPPPPVIEPEATAPEVQEPLEAMPPGPEVEPTPAEPTPTVEELLESIDMEDPTEEELQELEASLLREAGAANPPEFLLEGISVAGGRPVAVINGVRVFEGDMVSGARVILIMGGMVQLAFEGRTITLRF